MKNTKLNRSNGHKKALSLIHLKFEHATAARIFIAGSFNDWRPETTPMTATGAGRWKMELTLPPGVYEYKIVADGEWLPDPLATEMAVNPFGDYNSVLRIN